MRERIKDILLESIQVKEEILRSQVGQILEIAQLMIDCLKKDGRLLFSVMVAQPVIANILLQSLLDGLKKIVLL